MVVRMGADWQAVEAALGSGVRSHRPLGGSGWTDVRHVTLADGREVVVKFASRLDLRIEARMLGVLRERSGLPTPRVEHAAEGVLVLEFVQERGGVDARVERHAAELIASLHGVVSADGRYGLEFDGLIGALPQPNGWCASWPEFFAAQRLAPMVARAEGALSSGCVKALGRLMGNLGELVPERPRASLLHGDIWAGNVLARDGKVAAFIDPATYYGHAEVELAFIELFGTFGAGFFEAYASGAGWSASERREYARTRRSVYQVYPLLVHAALFGGGYGAQVEGVLRQLGV